VVSRRGIPLPFGGALATVTLGVLAFARPAAAQCPDGTPPPCGREVARASAAAANSVAVLPFENRARDTSLSLLAEGLADQITTNLGRVRRVEVKPPASVRFVLERTPREPQRLGRALGARWLVDGQMLASKGSVRVSVQLIATPSGQVRWTGAFQRPTDDLFAVISAVADSVATAIVGTLAPDERRRLEVRPTASNAALEAYARGVAALRRFDGPSVRIAVSAFESAVAADSLFADAWAGLAEADIWQDLFLPPRQVYPRARAAAERALALHPGLARALATLSEIALQYDWDPVRGEGLARDALRQDSTLARAWLYLGDALVAQGRADEVATAYRSALAADTLDEPVALEAAFGLTMARRTDEALGLIRRWRPRRPAGEVWDHIEGMALIEAGRCATAPPVRPLTIIALACAGRAAEARALADSAVAQSERGDVYVRPDFLSMYFAALGDRDASLHWFERAVEGRNPFPVFARVDALYDPMRADPRFIALLQHVRPAEP
jgi:TolB-like protein/tetratricopeptide (TPR) repeat protein